MRNNETRRKWEKFHFYSLTFSWLYRLNHVWSKSWENQKVVIVVERWLVERVIWTLMRFFHSIFRGIWFRNFFHWKIHYAPFSSLMDFFFPSEFFVSSNISNNGMSDFFEYWSGIRMPSTVNHLIHETRDWFCCRRRLRRLWKTVKISYSTYSTDGEFDARLTKKKKCN